MKHLLPSYRVPAFSRLFWIHLILALSAALLFWLGAGAAAKASHAPDDAVTVRDLAKPNDLVAASTDADATAFREEDAGFSAHYRVPHHVDSGAQSEGLPRLNVEKITGALLRKPDESNPNRAAGRHVDSGANFGIVELPMVAAIRTDTMLEIRQVTVYYDDRGWVVAYLPADDPAAGIWKYDPEVIPDGSGQPANDLQQNLLFLAINEVLDTAEEVMHGIDIARANHDSVGYYHWQHPKLNAFVLFSHESSGGTSEPVRFVVPPTIQDIRASAAVLDTTPVTPAVNGASLNVSPNVDGEPPAVTVNKPHRMAVSRFDLNRPDPTTTTLYEVTVTAGAGGTAAGAVMLLYTKPSS